ncbi:response regulator transcription factor [Acidomonas methanolica]|uniref:Two component transcriptional regulator cell cycle CtrA n=1 Tax=Acidomonas methanolica NBRC 104435 TaxID=1231351 RepID=A0A023D0S9_ACIMT|nr:response regulator transcription factor [Acidomonas methanolica]MBU2653426.1 response regulator transcription factor [Acidomonas methanolica]TCS32378.1 two-component system cell cycle response regulator CtrA [Acidomonas methanolica]GAJ27753.1 two component transcriptional regulator cell cycle CtrA [Acidomonas methanolica NBRC 104435]GBQ56842.1 two component response regulator CtrA [Acidomonas methanolica]GEK97815.1 DNA-binding response regulator [Acidomonas methanolica NBRC 104435]
MRILLVDSDHTASASLIQILRTNGLAVDHTASGREALEIMRHYQYDAVIIELTLDDIEGYTVIRDARLARISTPILVLTNLSRPQAKIKAFALGADDYLTRPFDTAELIARLQAILRRSHGLSAAQIVVGPLMIDLNAKQALVNGDPVHLTGKEYAILELLALRRGSVLTKDAFLNHLYGGIDEPEMKIIDVFICKLRRKLQQKGAGSLVTTVWGRGYILREEPVMTKATPHQAMSSLSA